MLRNQIGINSSDIQPATPLNPSKPVSNSLWDKWYFTNTLLIIGVGAILAAICYYATRPKPYTNEELSKASLVMKHVLGPNYDENDAIGNGIKYRAAWQELNSNGVTYKDYVATLNKELAAREQSRAEQFEVIKSLLQDEYVPNDRDGNLDKYSNALDLLESYDISYKDYVNALKEEKANAENSSIVNNEEKVAENKINSENILISEERNVSEHLAQVINNDETGNDHFGSAETIDTHF